MIHIQRDELAKLDNLLISMPIPINDMRTIMKYRKRIGKRDYEDYRYGSSWLDRMLTRMDLASMNRILKGYGIVVCSQ